MGDLLSWMCHFIIRGQVFWGNMNQEKLCWQDVLRASSSELLRAKFAQKCFGQEPQPSHLPPADTSFPPPTLDTTGFAKVQLWRRNRPDHFVYSFGLTKSVQVWGGLTTVVVLTAVTWEQLKLLLCPEKCMLVRYARYRIFTVYAASG